MAILRRILMATDFSNYSKEALDHAVYLAKNVKAELYLFHVFEQPVYNPAASSRIGAGSIAVLEWINNVREKERGRLMTLAKEVGRKGIKVHPILKEGIPFYEILKSAEETSADLIVLGTQGRTGLDRFMMGSVAERVAQKAPCPVYVVRPKTRAAIKKRRRAGPD
ncbi:universal stress protein [Candidatus Manganitrophus noduliformans]|uniref:Universal stress protein n=1 Tax=Candidatus Manganitrophus noduliformans TaxID=2606439 RepID=A0A7X6DVS6_9BACT|nr:universal stress protein [Candidatus Manganitrophus noduliformans]NKE73638.1 universal stress protein [Candidatus Manganitrophus noduliformans]